MGRSKSTMITAEMSVSPENVPLCVDLDGTLVRTDTLMESVLLLIKLQPWAVLLMPFWLLRGRAAFKQRIAEQVSVVSAWTPVEGLMDTLSTVGLVFPTVSWAESAAPSSRPSFGVAVQPISLPTSSGPERVSPVSACAEPSTLHA